MPLEPRKQRSSPSTPTHRDSERPWTRRWALILFRNPFCHLYMLLWSQKSQTSCVSRITDHCILNSLVLTSLLCNCLYLHYQESPDKKSAQWKELEDALSQRTHAVDQAGEAVLQAKYCQILKGIVSNIKLQFYMGHFSPFSLMVSQVSVYFEVIWLQKLVLHLVQWWFYKSMHFNLTINMFSIWWINKYTVVCRN